MPANSSAVHEQSQKKLDSLDFKIIKALLKNSRKPFAEIAKDCNVSTITINKRFNELMDKGIIRGSSVLIDLTHFGVECNGALLINVNPNQLSEFMKDIREMVGHFFVVSLKLTEKYNVIVTSPIKNLRELEKLKESIKQHSAVIDVKPNIWTYMKVNPSNLRLES